MSVAIAIVIAVVVILAVAGAVVTYNRLVRKRNRTDEAWSQIDVELKRRHDLVPNLVHTVAGYAAHERGTFEAVTAARSAAVEAGARADPAAVSAAENALGRTLRSLFAVAENYPQLRAEEGFLALQEQLTTTEDKLEYARRYYNTSVRDYDSAIQSFPALLIAGPFGFKPRAFFDADTADRQPPTVEFPAGGPRAPAG
ncbi:LemA family protein [Actinoplanes sp. NPDC049316]|uniref:LemA family protein n=1 Tax=Actinoplanes sp. NPDC049316 TaxID=3154727 RepID=UPI003426C5A9